MNLTKSTWKFVPGKASSELRPVRHRLEAHVAEVLGRASDAVPGAHRFLGH